jgi:molecular chaperone GrpE
MNTENQTEQTEAVEAEIVQTEGATEALNLGIDLPEDSDEAVRLLLTKLEESRDEATSYLDDLQRVAADFDNYRKRTIREQSTLVDRAAERLVVELMPVLDSFDAAVATEAGTDSERQLMSGMLNTREQLLKALESEGLEVIISIGEPFDPEVHEPVGAPGGSGALIVSQELRRGYKLKGRVLRAALVVLENSE